MNVKLNDRWSGGSGDWMIGEKLCGVQRIPK
jgi:hypothetical protein